MQLCTVQNLDMGNFKRFHWHSKALYQLYGKNSVNICNGRQTVHKLRETLL